MAIRDLEYDLLTVLQSKLEATAVDDQYVHDAEQAKDSDCRQLFEEIKRDDARHADRLRTQLRRVLSKQ